MAAGALGPSDRHYECAMTETFLSSSPDRPNFQECNGWECLVYSVFGDESSDETKSRVFAVAGVFGGDRDWKSVGDAWLDRMGGIIFHAAQCETDQGDFQKNTHADNQALYKDLTQIICRSGLMGRSLTMNVAGWRAQFPLVPNSIPYLACFRNVVHRCGDLARVMVPQDKVEFTFDNRHETEYNAGLLYSYMVQLKGWEGSAYLNEKISFANRKYVGIQVADLVAREAMKHLDNIVGPKKRRIRHSMSALCETGRFEFKFHTKEYFESVSQWPYEFGVDIEVYAKWLKDRGLDDNISNRQKHMFEAFPPDSVTPESFFRKRKLEA